jgi:predicted O-methyltransferase YrrM
MTLKNMPDAFLTLDDSYHDASGYFRLPDGSFDGCNTERPVCQSWYWLIRMARAREILETGTYYGYSTCHLAAAVRDNGGGRVTTIDPWKLWHLWEGSELQSFIQWIPATSQDALPELYGRCLDVLVIDSVHTYGQSSWELANFEPLVRPGGLILMHDTLLHDGVGCAVAQLTASSRFEVVTLDTPRRSYPETIAEPVSMGFSIIRKKANGEPLRQIAEFVEMPEHIPDGPVPVLRQAGAPKFRSLTLK